jgi:hypothetical protein
MGGIQISCHESHRVLVKELGDEGGEGEGGGVDGLWLGVCMRVKARAVRSSKWERKWNLYRR